MPLKLSDFNQGEIKEVEAPKKTGGGLLNYLKGLPVGLAKSAGEFALGAGEIGRKTQGVVGNITGINSIGGMGGTSPFDTQEAQRIRETTLAANAPGQGTGKFIGTAAQFLFPTSAVTKGQQFLGSVARQLPKFGGAQLAGKAAARFLPEAIGTGAVSAFRSGGDLEQAKQEGMLAGGFSVGLGALGGLARATYWPMLDDSVNKALGVQGRKSGGVALQQTAKKTAGLQVLKDRAKDLTVTADDGLKTVFDPQNASYNTTLQAWKQAREKVFQEYTEMASKAGEKATLDMSSIRQQMVNALDAPILSVEKNAVKSLLRDFDDIFKDPTKVDMQAAERFVKSLNENTVHGFFTGTSDAASSKVNAGTSRLIREMMDDVIEESTGAQYQATRSQYAALKSLEDDLVRKFQQDARSIGGGLPEYTGAFASGDIIGSALSLDPAQFAKGATLGTFSLLKRKLSNPERFLRRSFDLIDDVPSDLSLRIWGGSKALSEKEAKLAGDVAESIKNPAIGMSIKNVADDPSFNKGVTPNLVEEAKKYKSAEEFVKAQGTPMYHGSRSTFDTFETANTGKNSLNSGIGFYLADNSKGASTYGNVIEFVDTGKGRLLPILDEPSKHKAMLSELADGDTELLKKLLDQDVDFDSLTRKALIDKYKSAPDAYLSILKKYGYRGYDIPPEYALTNSKTTEHVRFNSEDIKPKSQLTDIWNQANSKTN